MIALAYPEMVRLMRGKGCSDADYDIIHELYSLPLIFPDHFVKYKRKRRDSPKSINPPEIRLFDGFKGEIISSLDPQSRDYLVYQHTDQNDGAKQFLRIVTSTRPNIIRKPVTYSVMDYRDIPMNGASWTTDRHLWQVRSFLEDFYRLKQKFDSLQPLRWTVWAHNVYINKLSVKL